MSCHYCGTEDELRPYGPGGTDVCFRCAMATPEREAETKKQFHKYLDKVEASPGFVGLMLHEDGPPILITKEAANGEKRQ